MTELSPKNDDKEYQDDSEDFKNIVKEQSNIEAHEVLMITDAVQCKTCYHCAIAGHTCCQCGQPNPRASGEVKKQLFKIAMNCFKKLTTIALVVKTVKPRRKTIGSSEIPQLHHEARDHFKSVKENAKPAFFIDIWKVTDIEYIFAQNVSQKVKEWDRAAEGPKREHVATQAEREHWKSTYYLKHPHQVEQTLWPRKPYFHTTTHFQQPTAILEWLARLE